MGAKTGQALWEHAHGVDDRPVAPPQQRKSIGVDVNWGVRLEGLEACQQFVWQVCGEVARRLGEAGSRGRTITLKVKRRWGTKHGEGGHYWLGTTACA